MAKKEINKGQEDLNESEQKFRSLIENISVGILALDKSWQITYLNPIAEYILNRPGDGLVGKNIWKEFPESIGNRFYQAYHEALNGQIPIHVEDYSEAAKRWLHAAIFPVPDGICVYFHDIAEQKNARTKVEESESRYRLFLDRMTDGFIVLDRDFCYVYANKKIGELVHRTPADLIGKNVWKEFPEAVGTATYYAFHKAMREQQFVSNIDYYQPLDLWQENRIYPSEEGLSVFIEDITERKRAEEELRESNERFYYVTKATSDVIWELNFENKNLTIHEGKDKFLGETVIAEWSMGVDAKYVVDEDRERIRESFRKARFDAGIQKWEEEYRTINKEGQVLNVVNNAIFIRNEKGHAVRVIGALTDITERKRLENSLYEQAKAQQLKMIETTLEAQEKERTIIGQELHDNVNQIVVATKLMLTVVRDNPHKSRDILLSCIENLDRVIIENRKIAHELVTPELTERSLLEELDYLIDSMLESNGMKVALLAHDFDEKQLTEQKRLAIYRIIQEQSTNIVKHAEATSVTIQLATSSDDFIMVIADDGKGMDPEKLRGGIGLKNMEGRLKIFDGKVSVETEPGKGFSLIVTIPINQKVQASVCSAAISI